MKIGEKIKDLRKERNITQEKLAEYLNISCQAVSKWENGTAAPDLQLIVPLANFFGVSTDELLGKKDEIMQTDLEEYRKKDSYLSCRGEVRKSIELWRSAVAKYPGNFECLCNLAYCLFGAKSSSDFSDDQETADIYINETIEICERILRDCTESCWRDGARQMLVMIHGNPHYGHLDEKKACAYAGEAPSIYCSADMLLMHAYPMNNEKYYVHQHRNSLTFIDCLTQNIICGDYKNEDDRIFACKTALNIWNSVIYDGNFLFYHCRMSHIYLCLATSYARKKESEAVMESLRKAKFHAEEVEKTPDGEIFYTSIFVNKTSHINEKCSKNYTGTNVDIIAETLSRKEFDFLRRNSEFIAFLDSLK